MISECCVSSGRPASFLMQCKLIDSRKNKKLLIHQAAYIPQLPLKRFSPTTVSYLLIDWKFSVKIIAFRTQKKGLEKNWSMTNLIQWGSFFCKFRTQKSYQMRSSLQKKETIFLYTNVCSSYFLISEAKNRTK